MKPIDEQHIAEPGLVVLDITDGGFVRETFARTKPDAHLTGHRQARPTGR
ncbi:hypothetical protein ACWCQL_35750 [Streptomyces sp. NPDC002073]